MNRAPWLSSVAMHAALLALACARHGPGRDAGIGEGEPAPGISFFADSPAAGAPLLLPDVAEQVPPEEDAPATEALPASDAPPTPSQPIVTSTGDASSPLASGGAPVSRSLGVLSRVRTRSGRAGGGGAGSGSMAYSPPRYRSHPAPAYPPLARKLRQEGTVLLFVSVDESGSPGAIRILRSSGSSELDAAARSAVARWTFFPAQAAGRAVAAQVEVPVTFRISA